MTSITAPNVVPSRPDPRDYQFLASAAPVPARVDLRQPWHIIKNQGQAGSCTGHTATSTGEAVVASATPALAPQLAYTMTKIAEGRAGQSGTFSMRDVLETGRKIGWCLESEFPYRGSEDDTPPGPDVLTSAATRKVERYESVPLGLSAMSTDVTVGVANCKAALASGLPIMISLAIGVQLTQIHGPLASQYYPPMTVPWVQGNPGNDYWGSHALVIVGYDDALNGFIAQNSWGTAYGDGGYFLLQYQCLQDFAEAWVIRRYAGMVFENAGELAARMSVVRLYVAVLGRAPDVGGVRYWGDIVLAGNSMAAVADVMMASPECKAKFATPGAVVCDALTDPVHLAKFQNRVTVAAYCALDMACTVVSTFEHCLDNVTEDPATIEPAKLWIRQHMSGASGVL